MHMLNPPVKLGNHAHHNGYITIKWLPNYYFNIINEKGMDQVSVVI